MSESHFNRTDRNAPTELNPWKSMWLHPRLTVRHLVNTNPRYGVLLLAMAAGVNSALDNASTRELGDTLGLAAIIGGAIIGGVISGIVGLYIGSWLVRWTGGWIGGKASAETLRTAFSWANLPNAWQLLLWVVLVAAFGTEAFASETPLLEATPMLWVVAIAAGLVAIGLAVWSLVLMVAAVAEVQAFTILKTIGNLLLSFLVILAIVFAIVGIVMALAAVIG